MKTIILFLSLCAMAIGAEANIIYAWGYADILAEALRAAKMIMSSGDYRVYFKIAVFVGIITAIIIILKMKHNADPLLIFKTWFIGVAVYSVFLVQTIDVQVKESSMGSGIPEVITDVPWAVGKPFVWFTGSESSLGSLTEAAYSLVNTEYPNVSYTTTGFMGPFQVVQSAMNHRILDQFLFQSVDNYIIDCVVPDVKTGYKDITTLSYSNTLWADLGNTSPSRVTMYYDNSNTGTLKTCTDAYATLTTKLTEYTQPTGQGFDSITKGLSGYSADQVNTALGSSSKFFMNYSTTGSNMLLQSAIANQFADTYESNGGTTYGAAKADQTMQANMIIQGVLGTSYLPVMKGILVTIFASTTIFLPILMVTQAFGKVLLGYVLVFFWLSIWHIGEQILHMIIMIKSSNYIQSVANGGVSIATSPVVYNSFNHYANMAASNYWMVPTFAAFVVGGFSLMTFAGIAAATKTNAGSAAGGTASEMSGGNANVGSVSKDNRSGNKSDFMSSSTFGDNTTMNSGFSMTRSFNGGNSFQDGTMSFTQDAHGNKQIQRMSSKLATHDDGSTSLTTFTQGGRMSADGKLTAQGVQTIDKDANGNITNQTTTDYSDGIATRQQSIGADGSTKTKEGLSVADQTTTFKGADGKGAISLDGKGNVIDTSALTSMITNSTGQNQSLTNTKTATESVDKYLRNEKMDAKERATAEAAMTSFVQSVANGHTKSDYMSQDQARSILDGASKVASATTTDRLQVGAGAQVTTSASASAGLNVLGTGATATVGASAEAHANINHEVAKALMNQRTHSDNTTKTDGSGHRQDTTQSDSAVRSSGDTTTDTNTTRHSESTAAGTNTSSSLAFAQAIATQYSENQSLTSQKHQNELTQNFAGSYAAQTGQTTDAVYQQLANHDKTTSDAFEGYLRHETGLTQGVASVDAPSAPQPISSKEDKAGSPKKQPTR